MLNWEEKNKEGERVRIEVLLQLCNLVVFLPRFFFSKILNHWFFFKLVAMISKGSRIFIALLCIVFCYFLFSLVNLFFFFLFWFSFLRKCNKKSSCEEEFELGVTNKSAKITSTPQTPATDNQEPRPLCRYLGDEIEGSWIEEWWTPKQCVFKKYTQYEARLCLSNKSIIFIGDSTARDLFKVFYFVNFSLFFQKFELLGR